MTKEEAKQLTLSRNEVIIVCLRYALANIDELNDSIAAPTEEDPDNLCGWYQFPTRLRTCLEPGEIRYQLERHGDDNA